MTFGERLKELREDNDEKQKDIAELLFVSNKVISDYERGVHFPRDEKIITAIAAHFGVSTDYLFGITNIKNQLSCNDFLAVFHSLTPAQKDEVMDFMVFLSGKNK